MQNLYVSFMRTVVPLVAGVLLGWAARVGLDLDADAAAGYVEAGATAVYYAVFRAVEAWAGRMEWEPLRTVAGVLLGWARPPRYEAGREDVVSIRLRLDADHLTQQLQTATALTEQATSGPDGKP
ncbi:hypothetical protein [Streptomyces taklimakanensis]|uniref:hypothetical protein n=1 Tax=Streptomyces taklimakanensis TaxID=2569853 RepID=UPI00192E3E9B|nr:hypothetical protein [Streptomyces taklimakanensis]